MKTLKRAVSIIAAVIFILPSCLTVSAENKPVSEILFELDTGRVLYFENAETPVPVGMMNKLMTVLAAANEVNTGRLALDKTVYAPPSVASEKGASVWLESGDSITVEELFKAVIIGNANDAALTLAAAAFGSEAKYLEKAETIASNLGLENTSFTSASGFAAPEEQISTAADLAKIISAISKIEFIAPMFLNRLDYVRGGDAQLVNTNKMARSYNGCLGYKYAFSKPSGYCIAAAAGSGDNRYGVILLGFPDETRMYARAAQMLDAAFLYYTTYVPKPPEDVPQTVRVKNGYAENVTLTPAAAAKYVIKKSQSGSFEARIIIPEFIYAPVKSGQTVGEIQYYLEGKFFCKTPIVATADVEAVSFRKNLAIILKNIFSFE
jgi:D-alanyl-D-alanine carboxypeptidase (penicillin-binding protein 5/6)